MIIEMMTKRDRTYGRRNVLVFDTESKTYSTQSRHMVPQGIEIKASDMKDLKKKLVDDGYTEVDFI